MNFFLFMMAGIAITCVVRWHRQVRRRNAQTWDSLVARLQPGWNSAARHDGAANEEATPEQHWQRVRGARGLCAMYQNAKVMQEMADYAARNNSRIDAELLATLRSDALQIRMLVLLALTQYAAHQVNEKICGNALRAASIYQEMSGRMSGLLQAGAPMPQFVGAR